ncbi:Fimbrial subunit ElfA [compost metagenome]
MLFKRLSLAALAAVSSQLALASPASGVLQFEGAVKGTTCSISVGGVEAPNPATVTLASVNLEELKQAGTDGMVGAHFDIDLKNCKGAATKASATFLGANGTTVTNRRVDNMATSDPAKNVQLTLYMENDEGGTWSTPASDRYWVGIEKGKLRYRANYYANRPSDITAGNFEAALQFTVLYQ